MNDVVGTQALGILRAKLGENAVPAKDLDFVSSLVAASIRGLSEKQWYWVGVLARRLSTPAPVPHSVGSFAKVYTFVKAAKAHLMYPKVRLRTQGGRDIVVYMSGSRSRVPDTLNVVSEAGDMWFGRVRESGEWEVGNTATPSAVEDIQQVLHSLANDPEGTAAAYGKLTGSCCFCGRKLTDERSTAVGYGPVCADHFSLSWG